MPDNKVCCMFSDPVPGHAVDNKDLETLASEEWSHSNEILYRCRKCGAYVLYVYSENTGYEWDNVGIDEDFIPIEDPDTVDGKYSFNVKVIGSIQCISARYLEKDWKRDRDWFYR